MKAEASRGSPNLKYTRCRLGAGDGNPGRRVIENKHLTEIGA